MPQPEPKSSSAASAALGEQWPTQATDAIVDVVQKVAGKTTTPIQKIGRAVVYGTFAAIVGVTAVVLSAVVAVRLLNNYVFHHHVWAAHVLVGALFVIASALLWTKAKASDRH